MIPGSIFFKAYQVQTGRGPHLDNFSYAFDENGDVFKSEISVVSGGVKITDSRKQKRFGIQVRWNVEGYGYLFMPADNEGQFYELPKTREIQLNLNYELAKSRLKKIQQRYQFFQKSSWIPSREFLTYQDLATEYLQDARSAEKNPELCSQYAQKALLYGLLASEMMELEKARQDIQKQGRRHDFFMGCDSRGFFQMDQQRFLDIFSDLFNYATITHYLKADFIDFEPEEGEKRFTERDLLVKKLRERNITVEGRPLFWIHSWVTPDWLRRKSYPEVIKYLTDHIQQVVSHYGYELAIWEVVNEMHDWANELELNREQSIELTRLACQKVREVNPRIRLLINNCCPFAEYVQLGKWHEREAKYPQRTPHQFTKELIEAGVDFDIIGLQMYFTKRPVADCIASIERYLPFRKKIHLAEIGSPSAGVTQEFWDKDTRNFSLEPYEWRRHWDEELQGDWLEYFFTYAYSQPLLEAANWYDFVDPYCFLKSGGLLRSPQGEIKAAVDRLRNLKRQWGKLPLKK